VEAGHLESVKRRLPDEGRGFLGLTALESLLALARTADCVALGPGIGTDSGTAELVTRLLTSIAAPVVLDADGINCLSRNPDVLRQRTAPIVLTPHPGEFARLTRRQAEVVNSGRVEFARRFAVDHHCTLLLKGAPTVIGTAGGTALLNPTGNSGLASGGSGDVLTGLVAGLIAQGAVPERAAYAAAFLHGRAADIAAARLTEYCLCAHDVVESLPDAFRSVITDTAL
jgi:NAD(P)H-hydrate epimerase